MAIQDDNPKMATPYDNTDDNPNDNPDNNPDDNPK
jgi:hypothetical protein